MDEEVSRFCCQNAECPHHGVRGAGIGTVLAAQRAYAAVSREKSKFGLMVPEAFVRGIRDLGYRGNGYAIAELIDNALQAYADRIVIRQDDLVVIDSSAQAAADERLGDIADYFAARSDTAGKAAGSYRPLKPDALYLSREELAQAEGRWQAARRKQAMADGVSLIAPETVFFAYDTQLGRDVTVEQNVVFGPGVTEVTKAKPSSTVTEASGMPSRRCSRLPLAAMPSASSGAGNQVSSTVPSAARVARPVARAPVVWKVLMVLLRKRRPARI